jgi:hypothetical protein
VRELLHRLKNTVGDIGAMRLPLHTLKLDKYFVISRPLSMPRRTEWMSTSTVASLSGRHTVRPVR